MRKAGLLAVGIAGFFLSSCWYVQQGASLLNLYCKAKPIAVSLEAPGLSEAERSLLERASLVRDFAMQELGLRENANYSTFVKTDKAYLADVVSGCAPDSFTPYLWDYPFVGALPYRGYFDPEEAKAEGARLKAEGWDVLVRHVDAFSTLGKLRDPLFSYMARYSAYDIANLIIHEQTHATVYLAGKADFDESLASFVGDKGAMLWIEAAYGEGSAERRSALDSLADSAVFDEAIHSLYAELDAAYKALPTKEERLAAKASIIAGFKASFRETWLPRFKNRAYEGWAARDIDNAYISLFKTYSTGMERFDAAYAACGSNLPRFIALARTIPADAEDPLRWLERACGVE